MRAAQACRQSVARILGACRWRRILPERRPAAAQAAARRSARVAGEARRWRGERGDADLQRRRGDVGAVVQRADHAALPFQALAVRHRRPAGCARADPGRAAEGAAGLLAPLGERRLGGGGALLHLPLPTARRRPSRRSRARRRGSRALARGRGRRGGAGVRAGGPAAARDGGGGEQRARDGGAAARTSVAGRGDRRSHPLRAGRDRAFGERAQPEGEVAPDVARGDGALGRARHRGVQGSGGTRSDRDPADADRRAVALTAVRADRCPKAAGACASDPSVVCSRAPGRTGSMANSANAALITGASAGLGVEYARLFAADGHDVVLVARRRERLDALAKELQQAHRTRARVIAADLASPVGPGQVMDEVLRLGLEVGVLVKNAGVGTSGPFAASSLHRELEMIQVNIVSLLTLTRALLPEMIARKSGRILNVGSTAGFQPGPFMAGYYASKAFVNSFTEALWYELRGTGVTATVSCPGATATEFAAVAGSERSRLFRMGAASPQQVAKEGYRAMMAGRPMVVHGMKNKLAVQALRVSPRAAVRVIAASLNPAPARARH